MKKSILFILMIFLAMNLAQAMEIKGAYETPIKIQSGLSEEHQVTIIRIDEGGFFGTIKKYLGVSQNFAGVGFTETINQQSIQTSLSNLLKQPTTTTQSNVYISIDEINQKNPTIYANTGKGVFVPTDQKASYGEEIPTFDKTYTTINPRLTADNVVNIPTIISEKTLNEIRLNAPSYLIAQMSKLDKNSSNYDSNMIALIGQKDSSNRIPIIYKDKITGEIKFAWTIAQQTEMDFVPVSLGGAEWTLKLTQPMGKSTTDCFDVNINIAKSCETFTPRAGIIDQPVEVINQEIQQDPNYIDENFDKTTQINSQVPEVKEATENDIIILKKETNYMIYIIGISILAFFITLAFLIFKGKKKRR